VAIAAGSPAMGMSAIVTLTSNHRQQSRVSFRIHGGEQRFPPELAEDQKNKVSGSTPYYLCDRGKPKRPFGTHVQDSAWHAWCIDLFAIQAKQCPIVYEWGPSPHGNNINPTGVSRQQGRRATTSRGACVLCSSMN
jgi:hypothetical protein